MKKRTLVLFLLILGLVVTGAGIYTTFFEKKGFVETTAVIDRIEEEETGTDEDGHTTYTYHVFVRYTVDGKEYYSESDFFAGNYKEGKEIKIFYDPADPAKIHGDSKGFGIYMMVIGPILIVAAVIVFLRR